MDSFGELLGGFGEIIGEMFADGAADGAIGVGFADGFLSENRRRISEPPSAYVRYLCGGPRELNVNDR
jgi:hypothetical protein